MYKQGEKEEEEAQVFTQMAHEFLEKAEKVHFASSNKFSKEVLEQSWLLIVRDHTGWWFEQQVDGTEFSHFMHYFAYVMDHFGFATISSKEQSTLTITLTYAMSEAQKRENQQSFCTTMKKFRPLLFDVTPDQWMIGGIGGLMKCVEHDTFSIFANTRKTTNDDDDDAKEEVVQKKEGVRDVIHISTTCQESCPCGHTVQINGGAKKYMNGQQIAQWFVDHQQEVPEHFERYKISLNK
jgi:hypothetical protein